MPTEKMRGVRLSDYYWQKLEAIARALNLGKGGRTGAITHLIDSHGDYEIKKTKSTKGGE